jgi:hypothetical protein
MLDTLVPGDVVTVTRIDRPGRTFDLFGILKSSSASSTPRRSFDPWPNRGITPAPVTGRLMLADSAAWLMWSNARSTAIGARNAPRTAQLHGRAGVIRTALAVAASCSCGAFVWERQFSPQMGGSER